MAKKQKWWMSEDENEYEWDIKSYFSGAFAKLRKEPVSFVISVLPSIRLSVPLPIWPSVSLSDGPHEQLGSQWMDIHEIWYFSFSEKSVPKIKVSLKSSKNNGYFIWRPTYIMIISCSVFFFESKIFQTNL